MRLGWRRLWADRSGSYAPLFAVLCVPLFGTAAASVEYSRVLETKFNLQHALDAAALATAKELASSSDHEYLAQYARDFFDANLSPVLVPSEVSFTYSFIETPQVANTVKLTAGYNFKMIMAGLIGVDNIDMDVTAEVAAGNRTVEVAIVVDNSGSMNTLTGSTLTSRMVKAKEAATGLINSLFTVASLSNKPDPVKIAVVPFAASVNVGSKYRGADWLDMNGWSSVHHEYFDWTALQTGTDPWPNAIATGGGFKSASTTTVSIGPNPPNPLPQGVVSYSSTWLTRWTLLDKLGENWAGCVEMRPWPYHANDTAPTDLTPDTLYVPMFSPDEPERQVSGEDSDYKNQYLRDYVRVGPDITVTSTNSGSTTKQFRRQSWTNKYNTDALTVSGGVVKMGTLRSNDLGKYGPNQICTTDPIKELSTNQQAAIDAVAAMDYGGYTNVQEGIAWGWRVLSPGAPFTQGRSYTAAESDKYLIVLTDGNNTYPGQSTLNETEYYPWGYGRTDRALQNSGGASSNVAAMDNHTATTCANIKTIKNFENKEAIRIFTIAYDVPDGSSVKQLLYDCASTGKDGQKYYYDVSGDAIAEAMTAIGNEISDLRISQ